MNTIQYSASSISAMWSSAICCILIPLIALAFVKKKTDAKIVSFFKGMLFSLIFLLIGLAILNTIILGAFGLVNFFKDHPVYQSIYYALITALCAQLGNYLAFKRFMQNVNNRQNALLFGIGLGGFECVINCAVVNITSLMVAYMVNGFGAEEYLNKMKISGEQKAAQLKLLAEQAATPSFQIYIESFLWIAIFCLEIALVIFVFFALKNPKASRLFPLAIVTAFIANIPLFLMQTHVLNPIYAIVFIGIVVFFTCVFAYRLYKNVPVA